MSICRYCHEDATEQVDAVAPCACGGSMRLVHTECILTWVKKHNLTCEVCKHPFGVQSRGPMVLVWYFLFARAMLHTVLQIGRIGYGCSCGFFCKCINFRGLNRNMSITSACSFVIALLLWMMQLYALGFAPLDFLGVLKCMAVFNELLAIMEWIAMTYIEDGRESWTLYFMYFSACLLALIINTTILPGWQLTRFFALVAWTFAYEIIYRLKICFSAAVYMADEWDTIVRIQILQRPAFRSYEE